VVKGRTYTPKETIEAEAIVAETYWAKTDIRFENQVVISIDFYNGNRRRRDIDNMAKLVLDALQGVAFDDDFQVVGLNLRKFLTTKEKARTEIAIYEVVVWPYESKDVP
jgi:crossover junction endodeoxyribonuclease RusA